MSNIISRAVSSDYGKFEKGFSKAESKEFATVGGQSQAMGLSRSEGWDLYKDNPLVFASKLENHEKEHGKIAHPEMFDHSAHHSEGNEKALADAFDNQEFAQADSVSDSEELCQGHLRAGVDESDPEFSCALCGVEMSDFGPSDDGVCPDCSDDGSMSQDDSDSDISCLESEESEESLHH